MDASVAPAPPLDSDAVTVARPARQTTPLLFASPHSGRRYTDAFVASSRLDPLGLRRSEDSFVDELYAAAPDFGAPLLAATFPRAWCDANREPWELDPLMFADELPQWVNATSPRVAAGLGTIARIVASGEQIYRYKLKFAEAEHRVAQYWQPYHDMLGALIGGTKALFGTCLLIDCHSMPSPGPATSGASGRNAFKMPDFVLGDLHGTACTPRVTRFVERALTDMGYTVRRNDPYAGGFITRHYGRPRDRIHVLQIEIARDLYMDEAAIERLPRFATIRHDITALVEALAREAHTLTDF
jgi:N-formylglutamate amidohydrolase